FMDTGLSVYYEALPSNPTRVALSEGYVKCGISPTRLGRFAKAVGAQSHLEVVQVSCIRNPQWSSDLRTDFGRRSKSEIDQDYVINDLEHLLEKKSLAISKLVWRTMCSFVPCPYLKATYQKNDRQRARHADSQLVHHLRTTEWVPQGNESFVRPSEASRDLL